jgi:hypothetical protein
VDGVGYGIYRQMVIVVRPEDLISNNSSSFERVRSIIG